MYNEVSICRSKTNITTFFRTRNVNISPAIRVPTRKILIGVKEEDFNCLFCYCPLYTLGKHCGGHCTYTESGIKSCQHCTFPHQKKNYDAIIARFREIAAVAARSDREDK